MDAGGLDRRLENQYTCIISRDSIMAASPLSPPGLRLLDALPRRSANSDAAQPASTPGSGTGLALAAVLVMLALLVAPEQPHFQEAICHRHNGVAACRVW